MAVFVFSGAGTDEFEGEWSSVTGVADVWVRITKGGGEYSCSLRGQSLRGDATVELTGGSVSGEVLSFDASRYGLDDIEFSRFGESLMMRMPGMSERQVELTRT